jgi:hypothetical protein
MTGLLSRMNSLGPTGKAAHKLAQQMSRALGAGAGSAPGSPLAAGGGGSQLARFNSLLSAAGSVSAANSAANTPRAAGADRPPLSRFASRGLALAAAAAAVSAATSPTAAGATAGSAQLSAQPSFITALSAQAAAEAGASSAAAQLDAAAWVQHFQQSQQVCGLGLAEVPGVYAPPE